MFENISDKNLRERMQEIADRNKQPHIYNDKWIKKGGKVGKSKRRSGKLKKLSTKIKRRSGKSKMRLTKLKRRLGRSKRRSTKRQV